MSVKKTRAKERKHAGTTTFAADRILAAKIHIQEARFRVDLMRFQPGANHVDAIVGALQELTSAFELLAMGSSDGRPESTSRKKSRKGDML